MQWGVRPLMVSSVEFAATAVGQQRAASCSPMATMARQILAAAVRLWFLEGLISAPALEAPAVWAKAQATADRRRAACGLLAAAVVRQRLAAAVRLWFLERLFSAPAPEPPVVSAKA